MSLASDVSNYTGKLTPEDLAAWKAHGVRLVIVQAVDPPAPYPPGCTREQIEASLGAGLTVDAYLWLWFELDLADIRVKLSLLDGLPIRRLWLDVEDTAAAGFDQVTTEAKIAEALSACDAYLPTQRTGIYTGRWFWAATQYAGNTTAFADRDLWDAHYDGLTDPGADFVPYGGWTRCAMKQYAGTSTLDGVGNVDLDSAPDAPVVVRPARPKHRRTPEDFPFPDFRRSAIAYRGALDAMGQQLADCQKAGNPA